VVFKISVATLVVNSFCQYATLRRLGAVRQIVLQRCRSYYKTKGFPLNGNKKGTYLVVNDMYTEFSKNRVGWYSDGLDGPGSIPGRARLFLFSLTSRSALELTQPPIQRVSGARRPEPRTGHSFSSSAKVKNGGAMPPLPDLSSWHSA
jgi:hypothetical protein